MLKATKSSFTTNLKQLTVHFTKLLSMNINPHSPSYNHVVMAHADKMREKLEETTIIEINITKKKHFDILFQFWEHLIYICQYGLLTKPMETIFRILHECITMKTFGTMAILLLKKETENQELLSIYQRFKVLCRETYLSVNHLFKRFEKTIIGEELMDKITDHYDKESHAKYSPQIIEKTGTVELLVPITNILASLSVVDKDVLSFIDEITGTTFDPSTTICHYNPHF